MTEAPGWNQGAVNFSGKMIHNSDTYHYPDVDQILTTTLVV